MVFSSLVFLYGFLPIVLLVTFLLKPIKLKNLFLMVASLLFYAWGEPIWVILLIATALVDYIVSNEIEKSRHNKLKCRNLLITSITINLGFLFLFKYSGFLAENIANLFNVSIPIPKFNLPIGISFYTFQTMSYTIDVYRNDVKAEDSFINFLMYVSFFPQLIAGPIVRYIDIAKQVKNRRSTLKGVSHGITRFLVGLSKKVLIANYAGEMVKNLIGGSLGDISILGSWLGIFFFAIQIYFDFSGYSDMAIGLGSIFGFKFLENFNYPYISKSITDFWRRWHMSLSTFFRDYVYIPLGGNRKFQLRNICIVWFLTGLWHGASWNYILWGMYFGTLLIIEKLFLLKFLNKLPKFIGHVYALFFILLGWVLFYFEKLPKLLESLRVMFGLNGNVLASNKDIILLSNNYIFIIIAIIACMPTIKIFKIIFKNLAENNKIIDNILNLSPSVYNFLMLLWCTASLVGSTYNPFLYFRF